MLWYVYETVNGKVESWDRCCSNQKTAIEEAQRMAAEVQGYKIASKMDWIVTQGCGEQRHPVWSVRQGALCECYQV